MRESFNFVLNPPITGSHLFLPGGFLDPDYGTNNKIWFASGTLHGFKCNSDQAPILGISYQVVVYDMINDQAKPIAAGPDGEPYTITSVGGATARKRPLGGGSAIIDVHESALPLSATELGVWAERKELTVLGTSQALPQSGEPPYVNIDVPFVNGLGFAVLLGGITPSIQLHFTLDWTPDVMGAQRYRNAQNAAAAGPVYGL